MTIKIMNHAMIIAKRVSGLSSINLLSIKMRIKRNENNSTPVIPRIFCWNSVTRYHMERMLFLTREKSIEGGYLKHGEGY